MMNDKLRDKEGILEVQNISLSFGGLQILNNISFRVFEGDLCSIVGPNGAGKTSLLNCISAFYQPNKGNIFFDGQDITHIPSRGRACLGIGRTFQGLQLFSNMTVLENILSGRGIHMKSNFFQSILYWPWGTREEDKHRLVAEEIIDFLEIKAFRDSVVWSLPYGVKKRADLGRALALEPSLLLLDEPMSGMNIEEKEDMCRFIMDIRAERGVTIVIIEHDMEVVMDISDRIFVLDGGQVIGEGTPSVISSDPKVIKAYLGEV